MNTLPAPDVCNVCGNTKCRTKGLYAALCIEKGHMM